MPSNFKAMGLHIRGCLTHSWDNLNAHERVIISLNISLYFLQLYHLALRSYDVPDLTTFNALCSMHEDKPFTKGKISTRRSRSNEEMCKVEKEGAEE